MKKWIYTFDVSDLWRNDDLDIVEKGREIAARLRARPWFAKVDADVWGGLDEVATALESDLTDLPEGEAIAEFNGWWDQLYDIADRESIWVRTVI